MAPKKPTPKKTTRVSPSARGEGSKRKPVAKRVSPSARGEGSTNAKATVAMKKKTAKVQEAGVANVAGSLAKGAVAIGRKIKSQTPAAKQAAAKARTEAMNARTAQQKRMMAAEQKMKDSQRTKYGSNASYSQTREGVKATTRATKEYAAEKARYEAMVKAYKGKKK
jgi:hypothetical protein